MLLQLSGNSSIFKAQLLDYFQLNPLIRWSEVLEIQFIVLQLSGVCIKHIGKHFIVSCDYSLKLNLFLFFSRRIDDDRGKSYELGQSAVKCFRGILRCWLQVGDKVEAFKKNQVAQNALFSRFHLHTGQVLSNALDPHYDNHLQVLKNI